MNDFNKAGGWEHHCSVLAVRMKKLGHKIYIFSRKYVNNYNQYHQYLKQNGVAINQINSIIYRLIKFVLHITRMFAWVFLFVFYTLRKRRLNPAVFATFKKELDYEVKKIEENILNAFFIPRLYLKSIFQKPDILHCFSPNPATLLSLKWAKAKKIPLIYDEQNTAKFDFYRPKYHEIFKAASVFKVLSPALKKQALRYAPPNLKIVAIPHVVDLPPMVEKKKRKGIVIGSMGRIEHEKNFELYVKMAKEVYLAFPSVRFLLAGDGKFLLNIKQVAKALGLDECFQFLGFLPHDDIHLFFSEIDIYVQTSRSEGVPIVISEAMAYGKPVVSTNVGGVADLVKDEETGILVPSEDLKALIAAVVRLIRDPQQQLKMGQKGREVFQREYHPDKIFKRYVQMYEDLINAK